MPCDIMAPEWPCTTVVFRKLSVSNRRILRSSCEYQASSQMRRAALFFLVGKAPSLDRGVFAGCQAPSNSRRTKEIRPQSSRSPHRRLCCLKQVVRSGRRSAPDPRNKGPGAGTEVGGAESVSRVAGEATTRPGTAEVGGGQTLGHTGPPLPPRTWAFAAQICSKTGKRNQAALINITHPSLELMNIQQPASRGQPLRPRPPRSLRLRHWRTTLSSHARATARQGRLLSWRARRPPCDRRGPRKSHRRSSSPRMPRRSRSSSWNGS